MTAPAVFPVPTAAPPRRRRSAAGAVPALLLGGLAALCYVLLRQPTCHEYDVYWLLPRLLEGDLVDARHLLALPVLDALASLLDGVLTLHERLKIVCGVCVGAAVAILTHAAWVLHRDLRLALAAGAVWASLPATVHFATMFELHGPFLPFAAAAMWTSCRIVAAGPRSGPRAAAVLGALTALAAGVHATGHLLVPVLACWLALEWRAAGRRWRAVVGALACFVAAHAAAHSLLGAAVLPPGAGAPAAESIAVLAVLGGGLQDAWRVVAGEWLWPFAPVSELWLAGCRGVARPLATALAAAVAAQLALCQWMLVTPIGYVYREFGAYQLPIAFLAVLLTVRAFGGAGRLAVLAAALVASAWAWSHPSKQLPDRSFGALALQHLQHDPVRLLLGQAEFDGAFEQWAADPRGAPKPPIDQVAQLVWFGVQNRAKGAEDLALYFHPAFDRRPVVVTQNALDELRAFGGMHARLVDTVLPQHFTLREVHLAGPGAELRGHRVEPKQ
jgi:hypothetical protein